MTKKNMGLLAGCRLAHHLQLALVDQPSEDRTDGRRRIHDDPDLYHDHIYGEHEAGGTGYLYLSPVPFEDLGFKSGLETAPMPPLTWDVLSKIPVMAATMAGHEIMRPLNPSAELHKALVGEGSAPE